MKVRGQLNITGGSANTNSLVVDNDSLIVSSGGTISSTYPDSYTLSSYSATGTTFELIDGSNQKLYQLLAYGQHRLLGVNNTGQLASETDPQLVLGGIGQNYSIRLGATNTKTGIRGSVSNLTLQVTENSGAESIRLYKDNGQGIDIFPDDSTNYVKFLPTHRGIKYYTGISNVLGGGHIFYTRNSANSADLERFYIETRVDNAISYFTNTAGVGINKTSPAGMLHVVGAGSTSGTTSMLVENSSNVDALNVKDDTSVIIGTYSGKNNLTQLLINGNSGNGAANAKGLHIKHSLNGGTGQSYSLFIEATANPAGSSYPTTARIVHMLGGTVYTGGISIPALTSNLNTYTAIGTDVEDLVQLKVNHAQSNYASVGSNTVTGKFINAVSRTFAAVTERKKTSVLIESTGVWNNTTTSGAINIGLDVQVSGGDVNYAGLFNGGNVGIGISSPTARLHVKSAGNTNTSTAFHIENLSTAQSLFKIRDDGSFGLGYNILPNSNTSVVIGRSTTPFSGSVVGGVLIGNNVNDNGSTSAHIAIGQNTSVDGAGGGVSIGSTAQSTGGGVAIGLNSNAGGTSNGAVSVGQSSVATGTQAIAIGRSASATGALGACALGNGTVASGSSSVAIGYTATASFVGAVSIGNVSKALNNYAVAIGNNTISSGSRGISIGQIVQAVGTYSIGMGYSTFATGDTSVAIGSGTLASSTGSLIFGYRNSPTVNKATNSVSNSVAFAWDTDSPDVLFGKTSESYIAGSGNLMIGSGLKSGSSAKVHIRGAGATSGTTALLVQNSNPTNLLSINNLGDVNIGTGNQTDSRLKVTTLSNNGKIIELDGLPSTIIFGPHEHIVKQGETTTTGTNTATIATISLSTDDKIVVKGKIIAQASNVTIGGDFMAVGKNVGGTASIISTPDTSIKHDSAGSPSFTVTTSGANIIITVTGGGDAGTTQWLCTYDYEIINDPVG